LARSGEITSPLGRSYRDELKYGDMVKIFTTADIDLHGLIHLGEKELLKKPSWQLPLKCMERNMIQKLSVQMAGSLREEALKLHS